MTDSRDADVAAREERDRRRLEKRPLIIEEIIETEKTYISDLEMIVREFKVPLVAASTAELPWIKPEEVQTVFSDIEGILRVNRELEASFEAMRGRGGDLGAGVCTCLKKFATQIKPENTVENYALYMNNELAARDAMAALEKRTSWRSFVETRAGHLRSLRLRDFLVKPIQRLCKYPLLLRELKNHTPTSHRSYAAVVAAHTFVAEIVAEINETKREAERVQAVRDIQARLRTLDGDPFPIVAPYRRLELQGTCMVRNPVRTLVRYFLLSDLFIVVDEAPTSGLGGFIGGLADYVVGAPETIFRLRQSVLLRHLELRDRPDTSTWRHGLVVSDRSHRSSCTLFLASADEKRALTARIQELTVRRHLTRARSGAASDETDALERRLSELQANVGDGVDALSDDERAALPELMLACSACGTICTAWARACSTSTPAACRVSMRMTNFSALSAPTMQR